MSFPEQNSKRIGQSSYWMYFGANLILAPALLLGGVAAMFSGQFVLGAICMMLVFPMGLFFRVIMMRRCRDIGWPTFLPWMPFICSVIIGAMNGVSVASNPAAAASSVMTSFGLSMTISLLDFVFMIVIGCIATKTYKSEYADIFGDDEAMARMAQSRSEGRPPPRLADDSDDGDAGRDRWDAAIAARLAALSHPVEGGVPVSPSAAREPIPMPRPPVRPPVGGFGRKVA
jgi:uncharacterized membrane protein YhaH (DUF805 family)